MSSKANSLLGYGSKYWDFQKNIGAAPIHSKIQIDKFQKYIKQTDKVLDFGCGGGYTLKQISCGEKFGVEVNDYAIKSAIENGITVKKDLNDFEDNFFDVVISNSALEHVTNPYEVLKNCLRVLKKGGLLILSVPHEELSYAFKENDINQHLYTWSPMCIGNLVKYSGFNLIEIKIVKTKQPPFVNSIYKFAGLKGVMVVGRIYRNLRYIISDFIKTIGVSADIIVTAEK